MGVGGWYWDWYWTKTTTATESMTTMYGRQVEELSMGSVAGEFLIQQNSKREGYQPPYNLSETSKLRTTLTIKNYTVAIMWEVLRHSLGD